MSEEKQTPTSEDVVEEEIKADVECEKCQEYLSGWKRALADYENLNKDLSIKLGEMRKSATANAAGSFLPVIDNFDQALKFKPEGLTGQAEQWLSGIMHVRNQLETVLSEMGVTPIGEVGQDFDANLHDAAGERTEEDKKDQSILEIVQRGWKSGETILRPARVILNSLNTVE